MIGEVLQKSHITFNLKTKDSSISISSLIIFIIDTNLSMIFLIKRKNQSFLIDIYLKVQIIRTDSSLVPVKKKSNNFSYKQLIGSNNLLTNKIISQY